MTDCVWAEVWAAKMKACLPIQALISRVLKQRKFKYEEGVSLNEQGQLFYLQMIAKIRQNTVWSRKWRTPPTNAQGKAKKPSISLPDIKVTDENNMWKQFLLQFLWISSPPSFFFYQETLWHTWISSGFEHGFSPGQVILGFKPAKGKMGRYEITSKPTIKKYVCCHLIDPEKMPIPK